MSYNDYLAGLRDGMSIGFKAGFRAGTETSYLAGYKDGYKDASLGLPYQANERLSTYLPPIPEPLPLPPLPKLEPAFKLDPPIIEMKPMLKFCAEIGCPGHSGFGQCLPKNRFDQWSSRFNNDPFNW